MSTLQSNDFLNHLFLSHNWGPNCRIHNIVTKIYRILKSEGITAWFDEERMMPDDLNKQMKEGIDGAKLFIACITKDYCEKVEVQGDNCRKEFMYASDSKKPMMFVRIDDSVPAYPMGWPGCTVQMAAAGTLVFDLAVESDKLREVTLSLARAIRTKLGISPPDAPSGGHGEVATSSGTGASHALDTMATQFLETLGMTKYAEGLVKLGVRSLDDLKFVDEEIMTKCGFTAIDRKKFEKKRPQSAVPNNHATAVSTGHPASVATEEEEKKKKENEALARRQVSPVAPGELLEAAKKGDVQKVEDLIDRGANLNERDEIQETPLHAAARYGHTECVAALLKAGADKDARNEYQQTPLHWAAANGHTECVAALLKAGADKDARTEDQWTPLHAAAACGRTECVAALLKAGADKDARNEVGNTPYDLANNRGHSTIKDMLE